MSQDNKPRKYKCYACDTEYDEMFPDCPKCGDIYALNFNEEAFDFILQENAAFKQQFGMLEGHINELFIKLPKENAKLKAEIERLKTLLDSIEDSSEKYAVEYAKIEEENAKLKEQVNALRLEDYKPR